MAFRRDSAIALTGHDTIFNTYRTIRQPLSECNDTISGSVLGLKVIKTASGWFWFFNAKMDTIKINSQGSLNNSWKFCDLSNNGYIEAKITNIVIDSVLGTTDSVKVITFQAKDSLNNDMSHILNQQSIRLSKHYGLSKMLDVPNIPDNSYIYQLAGKSVPDIGIQNLQWQEVFNFDIGDEFHYVDSDPYGFPEKFIKKIQNKTWNGLNSVTYSEEICGLESNDYGNTWTYYHQTATAGFNNNSYSWLEMQNDEFIRNGNTAASFSFMISPLTNLRIKEYSNPVYEYDTPCWTFINLYFYFGNIHSLHLEEGLGYTADLITMAVGSGINDYGTTLVFYKKGSETWGTPIGSDCASLSGTDEFRDPAKLPFKILPNPADEQTMVTDLDMFPGETLLYSVYTINGIRVIDGKTHTASFILMRNELPSGLYILVISDIKGNVKARGRVLFK